MIFGTEKYYYLGDYSVILFLGFTAYAIVKRQLFGIRVVLTVLIVGLIAILLALDIFAFTEVFWLQVVKGFALVIFLYFGYLLIRSVLVEIKRREEIEKLSLRLKAANDELAQINKHLEQLDQAKSEFLSIASHQLRTPISGILGYLSMLLEGDFGALDPKKEKIVAELLDASRRMARMINIFLNVSRIEAGRLIIQKQDTDMILLAEAVVKELQESARKKNLSLEIIKPAKKIPMASVDQDKIKDVLGNLVDNAIKYTQAGGIKISFSADPDYLTVAVKDTGVGIPKPEVSKLFNKFVRGSGIARIQPDGSGLGLFIAKKLTEANQGRIWVESEGQGKGTTFKFALPLKGK